MKKEQIEELRNWAGDIPRGIRWAQLQFPMKEPVYKEGMSFEEIKRLNREQPTYTVYPRKPKKGESRVISYLQLLKTHKQDYLDFLQTNNIPLTLGDKYI